MNRLLIAALAVLGGCRQPRAAGPAVFDLTAAQTEDLAVSRQPVTQRLPPGLAAFEVSYRSTEWGPGGKPHPIRLRGFLAERADLTAPARRVPAVIFAHGLGARADLDVALELARNLDVVALVISAPGLGGSEGRALTFQDASPLFDDGHDPRQSWLYAYVYGLLRAVSLVAARPEVDPGNIVLSGTSMGGIATLIVGGVDPRVRAILPVSSSGDLARGAAAGSWLAQLLAAARARGARPEGAAALLSALDPLAFADHQHGTVVMLVGAQDEFFPLPGVVATFERVRAPDKRLALMPDYDHGWYFSAGCSARCMPGAPQPRPSGCPADCPRSCSGRWPYCGKQASYNRQAEVIARWSLLVRSLIDPRHFPLPAPPRLERRPDGIVVHVSSPPPRAVRLAVSDNGGYTYGQRQLTRAPDGSYRLASPLPPGAIVFAEVEAEDGAVATSVPELPPGFSPPIRPFGPP
jgi:cephalosporin-C deacetylase-like acetyl esterase